MKRIKKSMVIAMLAGGTMFQGCLGDYFSFAVQGLPGTLLAEWLIDNDAIFDLFEDGGTSE